MSGKRKDSHPAKSENIKEDPESGEDASSEPTWANFSHKHSFSQSNIQNSSQSNLQNSSQSNLPLSNLGQYLVQNGNGSSSPSRSDITRDESIIGDDNSSVGNKDDDDDEDEDDGSDDKFDNSGDPERLKAFNMFVRLFVDENLDRHVPISKQPKEKIQAIIDSCTRQFPEFSDRARKRIRTYLKSCRRTKRSREQAGLDTNNRPTPPHLTSVHAEQMLARACENEAENAKRMRIGMEPISQPIPIPMSYCSPMDVVSGGSPVTVTMTMIDKTKMEYKPEQLTSLLNTSQQSNMVPVSSMPVVNGATAAMYRQVLQQQQPTVYHSQPPGLLPGLGNTNGQGLDSLKKPPLLNHKLNGTEMTAVRQLITGYRESAAFLLRSADELEHLIQIQPKL